MADPQGTRIAAVYLPSSERPIWIGLCGNTSDVRTHLSSSRTVQDRGRTPIGPRPNASSYIKEDESKLRARQAADHDHIWNALEAVWDEPDGRRLDHIAERFP